MGGFFLVMEAPNVVHKTKNEVDNNLWVCVSKVVVFAEGYWFNNLFSLWAILFLIYSTPIVRNNKKKLGQSKYKKISKLNPCTRCPD